MNISGQEILIKRCPKGPYFNKNGYAYFTQCSNKVYEQANKDPFFLRRIKFFVLEHNISNKKDDEGKCLDYIKIHKSNLHIPFTSSSNFVFLLQICSKSITTCANMFNNSDNFQGESYIRNTS